MGRNGAGKSTLLRLAKGLAEPTRGRIERARRGGAAAPEPRRLPDPRARRRRRRRPRASRRAGLAGRERANPRDLSGGERQRLALEVVLAGGPHAAVLLDEPTRGMDRAHKDGLAERIARAGRRGRGRGRGHPRHRVRRLVRRPRRPARPGRGDRRRPARRGARRRPPLLDRGRARDRRRRAASRGGGAIAASPRRCCGELAGRLHRRAGAASWRPASPGTSATSRPRA